MEKWAIHLNGYDLQYKPQTAIKSQALANFVADFSSPKVVEAEHEILYTREKEGTWMLHTDGTSNIKGVGLGIVLKSPQGGRIVLAGRCEFNATNNESEYEALIF